VCIPFLVFLSYKVTRIQSWPCLVLTTSQ
jgi:hypothetical protein